MHRMKPIQEKLFSGPTSVRMTVPVPEHVREAFQRLAASQGCSVGKAMGDWLADTVEAVEAMTALLSEAKDRPRRALMEVNSYATSMAGITQDVIQLVSRRPVGQASGEGRAPVGGEARATAAGARPRTLPPPVGNTGGKVPRKAPKTRGGKS